MGFIVFIYMLYLQITNQEGSDAIINFAANQEE